MTHFEKQAEFHQAFGQPVHTTPALPEPRLESIEACASLLEVELAIKKAIRRLSREQGRRYLRLSLILEEVGELIEAERIDNLVGIADALADIEVIADGTAHEYGIPLDAVRHEIHRSNMSKLEDGKPLYRDDGKVLKGSAYSPPDVEGVLCAWGYNPEGDMLESRTAQV